MKKYDTSKASEETKRHVLEWTLGSPETQLPGMLLEKLRAECEVKLRTRAQIDAEIVAKTRECAASRFIDKAHEMWTVIEALCREPCAPEPEGEDTERDKAAYNDGYEDAKKWIAGLIRECIDKTYPIAKSTAECNINAIDYSLSAIGL